MILEGYFLPEFTIHVMSLCNNLLHNLLFRCVNIMGNVTQKLRNVELTANCWHDEKCGSNPFCAFLVQNTCKHWRIISSNGKCRLVFVFLQQQKSARWKAGSLQSICDFIKEIAASLVSRSPLLIRPNLTAKSNTTNVQLRPVEKRAIQGVRKTSEA